MATPLRYNQPYAISVESNREGTGSVLVLQHADASFDKGMLEIPLREGVKLIANTISILTWDRSLALLFHETAKECGLLDRLIAIEKEKNG